MTDVWVAAFILLAVLSIANAVLLIGVMRQIGVLHQRIRPMGPGRVGPEAGSVFRRLELMPVNEDRVASANGKPLSILGYVSPGCNLCRELPRHLSEYRRTASQGLRDESSVGLVMDATETQAAEFAQALTVNMPVAWNPKVKEHYRLPGSPYVLVLERGPAEQDRLLAAGIVNTLEQLETLIDEALARRQPGGNAAPTLTIHPARAEAPSELGGTK